VSAAPLQIGALTGSRPAAQTTAASTGRLHHPEYDHATSGVLKNAIDFL
jgi:hypothetical protein